MLLRAKSFPVSFRISSSFYSHLPAYEDGTECSETSAYKLQTPGNYRKESIQHTEHGENLKSRICLLAFPFFFLNVAYNNYNCHNNNSIILYKSSLINTVVLKLF